MSARHTVRALLNEESGQDMIEYALVTAMIALGAVACLRNFSTTYSNFISSGIARAFSY